MVDKLLFTRKHGKDYHDLIFLPGGGASVNKVLLAGEWNECIECHTTPGDFKAFSCIDCHEHNDPNELRDDHDGVNGYKFESNACYECHPRGESD